MVIGVTGTGVVDADLSACQSAKQLVDRQALRLSPQVPESNIDGDRGADFNAGTAEPEIRIEQYAAVRVDRERIPSL